MPAKLKIETERVSWRVEKEDLELLRAVHGEGQGQVNEVVRAIVHAYCMRLRERLRAA